MRRLENLPKCNRHPQFFQPGSKIRSPAEIT